MKPLDRYLTEKKTEKELLKAKKLSTDLNPEIRTLYIGQHFKNAVRTSDDKAAVGSSWKEFWQIFTQEDFPATCPFCGLPMKEDEVDGCHIKIMGLGLLGRWSEKKYIIPGHHGCNMQLGEEFNAKIIVKAVEAIEK